MEGRASGGGERAIRLVVPDGEILDRLAGQPVPLPTTGESRSIAVFRDVYFDTPGAELELKPARVRVRHQADGRRTLLIDVRDRDGTDAPARHRVEAEVAEGDATPESIFLGDSEPARLLRAIIDPTRLEPSFEVETLRRRRTERLGQHGALDIDYDTLTVRRGELSGTLWEITVHPPDGVDVEPLIRSFESEPGVRITLTEPPRRAREYLDEAELAALEREVRAAREVAVVAHRGGRLALRRDGRGLRVPYGVGSGESASRRVLTEALKAPDARVRLLGTNAGGAARPALEVWLAEDVDPEGAGDEVVWLPLPELLATVGSGALREARTLAALEVAARSDISPTAGDGPTGTPEGGHEALELAVPDPRPADEEYEAEIPPDRLLNAELSRIAFDERILVFAESPETPLLERVRFLSMFGERQDDFFMSRVAGFKEELAAGARRRTLDGLNAHQQLDLIGIRARQVAARAQRLLRDRLLPALAERGIRILRWDELDSDERDFLREQYGTDAEAVLTPMAADASHPFPRIRNLRPAIGAVVQLPASDRVHFAAVELPGELPRFLPLRDRRRFVPLEELVLARLPELFTGLKVESAHLFRVTRSAKTQLKENLVADVLQAVKVDVASRPFRAPVRLEVAADMPRPIRQLILNELRYESPGEPAALGPRDVYVIDGLIDLAALEEVAGASLEETPEPGSDSHDAGTRPRLRFPPMDRARPFDPDRSVFDLVTESDRLVHFPYDDFTSTAERFIREAAEDPDVVSLKVTLYRTNTESGVVRALSRARELGKDAVALIEIKASFDEEQNIAWAKSLSAAGIHVVFSPLKYKVHAKAALVVRREGDRLRRYSYIGTGNLNAATARSYTDVALFTADREIGEELQAVFNILTGYSAAGEFERLLVSPFNMRRRFLELFDREIEHARAGRPARLRGQLNGLADRRMIGKLYEASDAGVEVDLMVREICALRPGVPGLSENIRIVSMLGRLLQHARIFEFANGGDPEYFIGSADWRPRNLSRRVEVVTPVRHPALQARLASILDDILTDDGLWTLQP
ncbi:MAG: polyphosphate kinase 1, partial [Gemmatimonadota bacterium]